MGDDHHDAENTDGRQRPPSHVQITTSGGQWGAGDAKTGQQTEEKPE